MLKDKQMAEDATQDVFEKIWKRRKRIRNGDQSTMKGLIQKIAMNICRDIMRTSWWKHVDRRIDADMLETADHKAEQSNIELMMDIMMLPFQLRQVILLYHFDHMTTTEISKVIGISQPAVVKRLKKAYQILKCEED